MAGLRHCRAAQSSLQQEEKIPRKRNVTYPQRRPPGFLQKSAIDTSAAAREAVPIA